MRCVATFEKEIDSHKNSSVLVTYRTKVGNQSIVARIKNHLSSIDEEFQKGLVNKTCFKLVTEKNEDSGPGEIQLLAGKDSESVLLVKKVADIAPIVKEIKEQIIATL